MVKIFPKFGTLSNQGLPVGYWVSYSAYSSAYNTNTSGDIIIGEKATYLRSRKHRGEQKFGKKVLNSTF